MRAIVGTDERALELFIHAAAFRDTYDAVPLFTHSLKWHGSSIEATFGFPVIQIVLRGI